MLLALVPWLNLAAQTPKVNEGSASGIRGIVVRWPIRPSTRAGETNSAPMPNITVNVHPQNGGPEVERTTGKDGRFEFNLPPGNYVVTPVLKAGSRSRVTKQKVVVKPNSFSEITLTCDSGIR